MRILSFLFFSTIVTLLPAQLWEPLGAGLDYAPKDLYADTLANTLYLCGQFQYADGLEVNAMARWDGNAFSDLSGGMDNCIQACPIVMSIARHDTDIYASPTGWSLSGFDPVGLARWDGDQWWPVVDGGLTHLNGNQGSVRQFLTFENDLFLFGSFDKVGTDTIFHAARWNGQEFIDLEFPYHYPPGHSAFILCAVEYNGELYVGGNFGSAPGVENRVDVARWDGEIWHVVGGGIKGAWGDIGAMAVYKDELYIGGDFRASLGNAGNAIMKLQGENWVDVGGSFDSELARIQDMVVYQNSLYVVGIFNSVGGGIPAQNIARWDGEKWCGLGSSIDNVIITTSVLEDGLYIGGGFDYIDNILVSNIAKWVGGDYTAVCGNPVSTEKTENEEISLTLFPNPATTHLQLTGFPHPATLEILDLTGRLVHHQRLPAARTHTIAVGDWPPGVYLARVSSGGRTVTRKIIVGK